jgi:hypothetical protein
VGAEVPEPPGEGLPEEDVRADSLVWDFVGEGMALNTDPPPPCKVGPCGYHCNCFNDIDFGRDGCQWCQLLTEEQKRDEKIIALNDRNNGLLRVMNDVHSLLSLVRHRHMPRGLDSLEKDIDQALASSEVALREWWGKEMKKSEKRNDDAMACYCAEAQEKHKRSDVVCGYCVKKELNRG